MEITADDVKQWISEWENDTMDFKSYQILSEPHKLGELMVAFGCNKFVSEDFGGRIIIGVNNERQVEKFEAKQGHEETIMNVARDKCNPSMIPNFQLVKIDDLQVYVITIPKMITLPFTLNTKEGKVHRIRVGSTIREPTAEELDRLYDKKNFENNQSKISLITKHFPAKTNMPIRHITIIPIDSNSKMINFDKRTTDWIKAIQPIHTSIHDSKLIQDSVHYLNNNFPSSDTCWGIVNELGYFSFLEVLRPNEKTVFIGREVYFLLIMLKYIQQLYQNFGYNQRILLKYKFHNVQNYYFKNQNITDPYHFTGAVILRSDFVIERTVSMASLNPKVVVGSILEEIARTCDWAVDEGEFSAYIEKLCKEAPQLLK